MHRLLHVAAADLGQYSPLRHPFCRQGSQLDLEVPATPTAPQITPSVEMEREVRMQLEAARIGQHPPAAPRSRRRASGRATN
jgi:hypothetical protein